MATQEIYKLLDILSRTPGEGTPAERNGQRLAALQDLVLRCGVKDEEVLDRLEAIASADEDTAVRVAAVRALVTIHKRDAVWNGLATRLLKLLANDHQEVWVLSANALAELEPAGKDALEKHIRHAAVDALWARLGASDFQPDSINSIARALLKLEAANEDGTLDAALRSLESPDPLLRRAAVMFLKTSVGWHMLMRSKEKEKNIEELMKAFRAVSGRDLLADILSLIVDLTPGYPRLFELFLPTIKLPPFIFELDTRSEYGTPEPNTAPDRPSDRPPASPLLRWKQALFLVDPRIRNFVNENILKRRVRLELNKDGKTGWYKTFSKSNLQTEPALEPGARVKIIDRSPHSSWFLIESNGNKGWIDSTTDLIPVMFSLIDESRLDEKDIRSLLDCRYKILSLMLGELQDSNPAVRQNMIGWLRECDQYFIPKEQILVANALWECMLQYGQGLRAYGVIDLRNEEDAMKEAVKGLVYSNLDPKAVGAIGGLLLKEGARELDDLYDKSQSQQEKEEAENTEADEKTIDLDGPETGEKSRAESYPNRDRIMPFILAALESREEQVCELALVWVYRRSSGGRLQIPGPFMRTLLTRLRKLADEAPSANVRSAAKNDMIPITEQHSKFLFTQFDRKGALAIDIINELVEMQSPAVMSSLIRQWGYWIAETDKSQLVEATAVELRSNRTAILPLVERLRSPLQLTEKEEVLLRDKILDQKVEQVVIDRLLEGDNEYWLTSREKERLSKYQQAAAEPSSFALQTSSQDGSASNRNKAAVLEDPLDLWIKSLSEEGERFRELEQTALENSWEPDKKRKEFARLFWKTELEHRELLVRRRIALQLAEMSSPRFFESAESRDGTLHPDYMGIKSELKKHAVPYLAHKLPEEPDLKTREHLARTLANVGELEAVDALALAVVAEDRTKENRRQVLAEYYLEPSKRRSEQAAKILVEAVSQAERTMRLVQVLSTATFLLGVVIVGTGLYLAVKGTGQVQQYFGVFASIGGVAGIITLLIKGPLNDIQNSIANLVQLETAFTNFIWELNLNSTYIQSQYVEKGSIANDVVASTIERMESAMSTALSVIALYMEEGRQRVFAHINALTPGSGEPGAQVKIIGQYLKVEDGRKKDPREQIMVAIDHMRTDVEITSWGTDYVTFRLPQKDLLPENKSNRPIWISLIVNGVETNAVPFEVRKAGRPQSVPESREQVNAPAAEAPSLG
jgi:hypothetical protein